MHSDNLSSLDLIMLKVITKRSLGAHSRLLMQSRGNSRISAPIGQNLYEIAGSKHDVVSRMVPGGVSEPLSFLEGGKIAHLADGSGVCSQGGSVVHAAVTTADNPDATDDFLPLTVDYRSRAYAFGRIPSVHNRRERHGNNEDEVLISRIIDRAVRPLFPKGLVNQVQLIATAHAADKVHDPTIVSVNAASLALMRSSVEWKGPVGCVRVGMLDGKLILHPTVEQMQTSTLDLVYAGTHSRTLMLECVGDQVPEAQLDRALELAQLGVKDIIDAQIALVSGSATASTGSSSVPMMITARMKQALITEKELSPEEISKLTPPEAHALLHPEEEVPTEQQKAKSGSLTIYEVPGEMQAALEEHGLQQSIDMFRSCGGLSRKERGLKENGIQVMLREFLWESERWGKASSISRKMAVERCMKKAFRAAVLGHDIRVDGRGFKEVREVLAHADVLPSVHGSSFFGRGDTHVLSTATLGALSDAKSTVPLDGSDDSHSGQTLLKNVGSDTGAQMGEDGARRTPSSRLSKGEKRNTFFLHYDFPPYCTGVVGNAGAVNRRMVGHGNLAERALRPVMPDATEFPYTVRAFAECTSSSGSSSMASACSATLAMLDAGVPLKGSVAGVSVGLVTAREGDPASDATFTDGETGARYRLLTDILGTEDHYGDMDFKIAGTSTGVTAMQLDMKLEQGLSIPVLQAAMREAKKGREHLLRRMSEGALDKPRAQVKSTAPAAEVVTYNPERKRLLIGPGGEMVRYIEDTYDCSIDTSEEGIAYVYGSDREGVKQATALVLDIVTVLEPGQVLSGEVMDIKDFGVFVKLTRSQEAILHLSEISHDSAITKRPLEQSMAVGQRLQVQVLSVDKGTGAVRVSRKALLDPSSDDDIRASPADDVVNGTRPPAGGVRDPLPTFPVIPPRKWSKDYFRSKVASEEEVESAMRNAASTGGAALSTNSHGNKSHDSRRDKGARKGQGQGRGARTGSAGFERGNSRGKRPASSSPVDAEAMGGIIDAVESARGKRAEGAAKTHARRASSPTPTGSKAAGGADGGGGIIQSFLSFVGMGQKTNTAVEAAAGAPSDKPKANRNRSPSPQAKQQDKFTGGRRPRVVPPMKGKKTKNAKL